ncbi:cytochrome b561 [Nematolebias whitei]|uniref:cytochrome b561 n=1 Tax=Nematolebias whitei TaxID=451745 RepID=UPI001898CC3A|nr:cytochrome b561 [Nematolebias whitei]
MGVLEAVSADMGVLEAVSADMGVLEAALADMGVLEAALADMEGRGSAAADMEGRGSAAADMEGRGAAEADMAILVYRVFRNETKRNVKLLHGIIHLLALIISIVGVVAVFDFHKAANIPDMYSLHSWCGMATLVLFCVQWVMGLLFFLFPGMSSRLRSMYLPIHMFCGLTLLLMAIGTSLLGITEKLLFSITSTYSLFAPEGMLANVLGILLVLYGGVLCYLMTREEYRRPPNPEEETLSVHFKTLTEGGSPGFP